MTNNRLDNFRRLHHDTGWSYRVLKFVDTAYSIFRSLKTMSEKQAVASITTARLKKKKNLHETLA